MPFVTRTNAKRQRSPTDAKKIFIGRTNEMHFFMENILEPDIPTHNILSISGQGGVGKSTLLAQFANVAHTANFQDYCLIAQVDERQITAASAIEKLAKELHITGEFEKALGSYKESLRKLRYKQGKTHVAVASDAGAGLASSMVKMLVPIPAVNEVTGKGAETLTKLTFKQIYFRQRLKHAERLEDPMGALTATFVKELNRLADRQATLRTDQTKRRTRVLLFFDSFEQLASEVVSWILDYFLEAEISQNVVLVTAGRNPIERSFPGDPKRWLPYINGGIIHSMLLDNFNEDQTRKYLTRRNITDNAQIDKIWELSRGLPLYLTFLTADIQETIDVTAGVVANFLRWIPEQEQTKRQLVLDASLLSRPFNQDELALFTYLSEDERSSLYRWLSEQPFVKSSVSDGRYSYHELAQELFNRHLYQSAPDACSATRRVIAAYYQSHLNKVQEDGNEENSISAERLELLLALLSQLFQLPDSIGYIQAIEQVLNIYDQGAQMGEITKLLREISNKQSNGEVSAKAIQIITLVLQYLEPGTGNREILEATSNLLEIVADEASFPKELLAHIYNNRGISYYNLSQYRQAISDFTRSIELSPEDAVLSINRGDTYTYLEEYQQAIADFSRAIELAPNNANYYNQRANTYDELRDYQQAIADYSCAIELVPEEGIFYANRANTYVTLQDYQQAIANYSRAIELTPAEAAFYANRASTYAILQDYQQAIADLSRAIELDPNNANYYNQRANVYDVSGERQQAISDFSRAIELDPAEAIFYYNRGDTYTTLQDYQQAITDFSRAIELAPAEAIFFHNRANTYAMLQDYQQAIVDLSRTIELAPAEAILYANRGDTYAMLQDYQQAIADLSRAIELDPNNGGYYNQRANAYDMRQQAIADYSRAIELAPAEAIFYANRGDTYAMLQDYRQAIADLSRAIELDPNNGSYSPRQRRSFTTTGVISTLCCRITGKPSPTSPAPSSSPRIMGTTITSGLMPMMFQGSASKPSPTTAAPSSSSRRRRFSTPTEVTPTPRCGTTDKPSPTFPAPSSST